LLARGVELEVGTAKEIVVRMAHDRMLAAELVKVQLMTQCALTIFQAVAAQGELQGAQEAQAGITKLLQSYGEMVSPFRAIARDEAAEKAEVAWEEEKGKVYSVRAIGDKIGKRANQLALQRKKNRPTGRLKKRGPKE